MTESKKQKRGFASMDHQRVRELAVIGGKRSQEGGRAHVFTSEEARAAGRKGGMTKAQRKATA